MQGFRKFRGQKTGVLINGDGDDEEGVGMTRILLGSFTNYG